MAVAQGEHGCAAGPSSTGAGARASRQITCDALIRRRTDRNIQELLGLLRRGLLARAGHDMNAERSAMDGMAKAARLALQERTRGAIALDSEGFERVVDACYEFTVRRTRQNGAIDSRTLQAGSRAARGRLQMLEDLRGSLDRAPRRVDPEQAPRDLTRPSSPSAAPLDADDGADGASVCDDAEDGGRDCDSISSTDTFSDADEAHDGDVDPAEATAAVSDVEDKGEELESKVQGMPSVLMRGRRFAIDRLSLKPLLAALLLVR